ncbi:MAG: DUF309 domain-containing protein [Thermodesulfobacteriota bacterium]
MTARQFDPLNDRLSRDIRNQLSVAFAEAQEKGTMAPVEEVAARSRASDLAPAYEAYIADRLNRYRQALRTMTADRAKTPFSRALLLWDLGLFFEVHEILEHSWHKACGPEREILQAMIRAAGMYIKLAMGQPEAARKMATKALAVLERHRALLETTLPLNRLLAALKSVDPNPPKLYRIPTEPYDHAADL